MVDRNVKKIYVDYDMKQNRITNAVIGPVEVLPENAVEGQVVMFENNPYVFVNGKWERIVEEKGKYQLTAEKNVANGYVGLDENILIPNEYLKLETAWNEVPLDTNIPSEKLVKGALDDKIDRSVLKKDLTDPSPYTVASTKAVADELKGFLGTSTIINNVDEATDSNVYSSNLVKGELDAKLDDSQVDKDSISKDKGKIPSSFAVDSALSLTLKTADIAKDFSEVNDNTVPSSKAVNDALSDVVRTGSIIQNFDEKVSENTIASSKAVNTALEGKTDILKAIPIWSEGHSFMSGSSVIGKDFALYISKQDNNTNEPGSEGDTSWMKVLGGGTSGGEGGGGGEITPSGGNVPSIKRYYVPFGNILPSKDGTCYEFEVPHGLGVEDVITSVMEYSTKKKVLLDTTMNYDVTVFSMKEKPVGDDLETAYVINIMSSTPYIREEKTEAHIEDTPKPVWKKNYKTTSPVFVQTFDKDGNVINGQVRQKLVPVPANPKMLRANAGTNMATEAELENEVSVDFGNEQSGTMIAKPVDNRNVFSFVNQSEWRIEHGLDRVVAVQTFNSEMGQIRGDIIQSPDMRGVVIVMFSEPMTGTAIII